MQPEIVERKRLSLHARCCYMSLVFKTFWDFVCYSSTATTATHLPASEYWTYFHTSLPNLHVSGDQ